MANEHKLDENSQAVQCHLNIVQNVIQRMSANSALCKGWCVTLVSAILVVVANQSKAEYAFISVIPLLLFTVLDMYYLALERAFRNSYNEFIDKLHSQGVSTSDVYAVQPKGSIAAMTFRAILSFSIWPFYFVLLLTIIFARYLILA